MGWWLVQCNMPAISMPPCAALGLDFLMSGSYFLYTNGFHFGRVVMTNTVMLFNNMG
jgi:hypothetical protein